MRKMLLHMTLLFSLVPLAAYSQSLKTIDERQIRGWTVKKLETPNDGLSCQALKCNTQNCSKADTSILLWGSVKRNAVTPMIGANFAAGGARAAQVTVGKSTFPFEQARNSSNKRYIAKDPMDDSRLLRSMRQNPSAQLSFKTNAGEARFKLRGLRQVLSYFERECGIKGG